MSLLAALFFAMTTLLGAWRREGRDVAQTSTGALLGLGALGVAVLTFVFAGAGGWLMVELSNASASTMQAYPPASVSVFRLVALTVFVAALAGIVSTGPAWTASGWGIWRKLHHSLFALSLAALAIVLVLWKAIFAATA
jgi:hypothetical protein